MSKKSSAKIACQIEELVNTCRGVTLEKRGSKYEVILWLDSRDHRHYEGDCLAEAINRAAT